MRDSQRHQRAPKFSEQYSEFLHAISKSHTWFEEPDDGAGVDEIDEENEQTDSGETDDYSDTTLESLVEDGQDVSNVSFQWFHPGDVSVAPRDTSQQFLTVAAYQQLAKQSMEAATPVGHQHEKVAEHKESWRKMISGASGYFVRMVLERCAKEGGGLQDRANVLALCELAEHIVENTKLQSGDAWCLVFA